MKGAERAALWQGQIMPGFASASRIYASETVAKDFSRANSI
jgi:hypothetical protein